MSMNRYKTLNVNHELENIGTININVNIKGVMLELNDKLFIVTLHQYCPIKSTIIEGNIIDTNMIHQSSWNELLIIKNVEELGIESEIIKKFKLTLPEENVTLYCDGF